MESKEKVAMHLMKMMGGSAHSPDLEHKMSKQYDDAYMLCKVLDSLAGQAIALKKKIAHGHQLPSWAEYKVYKAGDAIKSAMSSTFSISDMGPKVSVTMIKRAMAQNRGR
tara:strand:+ start:123 stop:452 length:330 start_codon:yes stop_codon:yes gene_type:complete